MMLATHYCQETEWTLYWERALRRRRWVEHDGLFYPIAATTEEIRQGKLAARKSPRATRDPGRSIAHLVTPSLPRLP